MSGKQLLKNKNVLRFFAHTLRALRLSWLGKRQQATCLRAVAIACLSADGALAVRRRRSFSVDARRTVSMRVLSDQY